MNKCLLGFAALLLSLICNASAILPTGQIYRPSGSITVYHASTDNYTDISFSVASLLKLTNVAPDISPKSVSIVLVGSAPQYLYLVKNDGSTIYAQVAIIPGSDSVDTSQNGKKTTRVRQAASISFFDGGPGCLFLSGRVKDSTDKPKHALIYITAAGGIGSDSAFIHGKLKYEKTISISASLP